MADEVYSYSILEFVNADGRIPHDLFVDIVRAYNWRRKYYGGYDYASELQIRIREDRSVWSDFVKDWSNETCFSRDRVWSSCAIKWTDDGFTILQYGSSSYNNARDIAEALTKMVTPHDYALRRRIFSKSA